MLYKLTRDAGNFAAGTLVSSSGGRGPSNPALPAGVTWGLPAAGILGSASVFKQVITDAPVHESSAQMIPAWIARDITPRYKGVAAFNAYQYNTPIYIVDDTVPGHTIGFRNEQAKTSTPPPLYQNSRGGHFNGIPVATGMIPAAGNDGHLAVYRPSSDQLWDLWRAKNNAVENNWNTRQPGITEAAATAGDFTIRLHAPAVDGVVPDGSDGTGYPGWSAVWGGRIDNFSASASQFPSGMGTAASGLFTAAGSIGIREAQAGVINHAISLAIYAPRKSVYSYPATRTDGYIVDDLALPEGIRLRLRLDFDVEGSSMHPIAKMIARAAQIYGFIVTDKAGTVNVSCESGAPFVAAGGPDPWDALRNGTPAYNIMRGFPWSQLEVLPMNFGKP